MILNERISILKREKVVVGGRPTLNELPFYKCWCEVLDLIGNELYQAINIKLENTLVFKVRYCKKLELLRDKESYIVKWQNRTYEIYYVDFIGYKKDFIKIKCKEVL